MQQRVVADRGAQHGGVVAELADLGRGLVDERELRRRWRAPSPSRTAGRRRAPRRSRPTAGSARSRPWSRTRRWRPAESRPRTSSRSMAESATCTERNASMAATRRIGTGERRDLAGGAQPVAADGPHGVAGPDQRGVDGLRASPAIEAGAEAVVELALERVEAAPVSCSTRSAMTQRGRGSASSARTPGHARAARVDRLDRVAAATACSRLGERSPSPPSAATARSSDPARAPRRRAPGASRADERPRRCRTWEERLRGGPGRTGPRRARPAPPAGRRRSAAASASVASTITRTTGSVPDGRTSTRPSSPSSSSTSRTRLQNAASRAQRVGAVDRDVAQHLRARA